MNYIHQATILNTRLDKEDLSLLPYFIKLKSQDNIIERYPPMYSVQVYKTFDYLLLKEIKTDCLEEAEEIYFGYYDRLSNNNKAYYPK